MIESRPNGDGNVRVTFRLADVNGAKRICVVGEFNAWSSAANPMERVGDEAVTEIVLSPGRLYRFRYLLDEVQWENDWAADSYVANEFGGEDSVLDLTDSSRDTESDKSPREMPQRGLPSQAAASADGPPPSSSGSGT
jgi:1,4-alpha-glucan branching enzyme